MARGFEFSIGEWYHCFSRGVEKRTTYEDKTDYDRFLSLLYLANTDAPVTLFNQRKAHSLSDSLAIERGGTITTIGAYCLMPNHYHLILKEEVEGGISKFMQKVGTGYTMYFNTRYKRTGNLFIGPFRAQHIADDKYLQRVIRYVHINPAELIEPKWKYGKVSDMRELKKRIVTYPYSSLKDYANSNSPTRHLLGHEVFEIYEPVSTASMLEDALDYYKGQNIEVSPQY